MQVAGTKKKGEENNLRESGRGGSADDGNTVVTVPLDQPGGEFRPSVATLREILPPQARGRKMDFETFRLSVEHVEGGVSIDFEIRATINPK